jgi:hypothetical protein
LSRENLIIEILVKLSEEQAECALGGHPRSSFG